MHDDDKNNGSDIVANLSSDLTCSTGSKTSILTEIVNSSYANLIEDKSSYSLKNGVLRPGEEREFILNRDVKIVMCWIPPGKFTMGSPPGEMCRDENETQHEVEIENGFWITKYPITNIQWCSVVKNNPIKREDADKPHNHASWKQITDPEGFMSRINDLVISGNPFQLPCEAQWEYACRAGTTTSLNNGKELTKCIGICDNLDEIAFYRNSIPHKLANVGLKLPNKWGLHDMHGNVWEWCEDLYLDHQNENIECSHESKLRMSRVIRGGCIHSHPGNCRSARRISHSADKSDCGFRLIRRSNPNPSNNIIKPYDWVAKSEFVHEVLFTEEQIEFSGLNF
jgi:sulfatase modifying factor 1